MLLNSFKIVIGTKIFKSHDRGIKGKGKVRAARSPPIEHMFEKDSSEKFSDPGLRTL